MWNKLLEGLLYDCSRQQEPRRKLITGAIPGCKVKQNPVEHSSHFAFEQSEEKEIVLHTINHSFPFFLTSWNILKVYNVTLRNV